MIAKIGYDIKFRKFPWKFQMHWLGPYIIKEIANGGVVQLMKLNGELFLGKIDGSRLIFYRGDPALYEWRRVIVL